MISSKSPRFLLAILVMFLCQGFSQALGLHKQQMNEKETKISCKEAGGVCKPADKEKCLAPKPALTCQEGDVCCFDAVITDLDKTLAEEQYRFLTDSTTDPPVGCSVTDGLLTGSNSGVFGVSPYRNNEACEWQIEVDDGQCVHLEFDSFELESHSSCGWDSVEVFDGVTGMSSSGKLCGYDMPSPVTTSSNIARVVFNTDSSSTRSGFQISYSAVDITTTAIIDTTVTTEPIEVCTGNEGIFTAPSGKLWVGGLQNEYSNNENCRWEIRAAIGKVIDLEWRVFDIQSHSTCNFDGVEVFDGQGRSLSGKLCGRDEIPRSIRSPSNVVVVVFTSDGSVTGHGFQLKYTAVKKNFQKTTGVIRAGTKTSNYINGINREWVIRKKPKKDIYTEWKMVNIEGPFPECPNDYVQILDAETGRRIGGRVCGTKRPKPRRLRQAKAIRVLFRTNDSVSRKGFKLKYKMV